MKAKNFLFVLIALVSFAAAAQASAIRPLVVDSASGSFALAAPDFVLARVLAAAVAESITVPSGPSGAKAQYVSFSANCDFYANYTTTAATPAADNTTGTAPEFNPTVRLISDVTTISVVTPDASCIITAAFYM